MHVLTCIHAKYKLSRLRGCKWLEKMFLGANRKFIEHMQDIRYAGIYKAFLPGPRASTDKQEVYCFGSLLNHSNYKISKEVFLRQLNWLAEHTDFQLVLCKNFDVK